MKHIVRTIAILVLALVTTLGAGATTKTVTYTLRTYHPGDGYTYFFLSDGNDQSYELGTVVNNLDKTISFVFTDGTLTISSSGEKSSIAQYTSGNIGFEYYDYTVTFESENYFVTHIKISGIDGIHAHSVEADNITKSGSAVWPNSLGVANTFEVTLADKLDFGVFTMEGIDDSYSYTGSAITPEPTELNCTSSSQTVSVTKGTDYTVAYSANTYVGTATITLTGMGNYEGTCSTTFAIVPRERSFGGVTVTDGYSNAHLNTLAIADGTDDIAIPEDIGVGSVTYDRTFTAGSTATVTLPFSVDVSKVSGGTFYGLVGIDKHGQTGWEVVMKQVTGILQPHQPYLFRPTATTMTFDLGGQTVTLKANTQNTVTP